MGKPDVTEFLTTDNLVTSVKNEKELIGSGADQFFSRWSRQTGGAIINWSTYYKKIESTESLPKDYADDLQNLWELYLGDIQSMMTEEEERRAGNESIYSILIETPKPNDLRDYKKLTIPKEVYNKLYPEDL
jgi:hypothetical protein